MRFLLRAAAIVPMVLGGAARSAAAQACVPAERPFFDFQVSQPAAFVDTTSTRPRPVQAQPRGALRDSTTVLVQFVVDTNGVPEVATFKVLKSPSRAASDSASLHMGTWRYAPARKDGCRVRQLVQTVLVR